MNMVFSRRFLIWAALCSIVGAGLVAYRLQAPPSEDARPNYSLIEPGLYIGGACVFPPRGTEATLNLSERDDAHHAENYRWEAIPDAAPAPPLDWLRNQVDFIDAQRRARRTVFVHCDAGISRSAMVAAAYLMWRDHLARDKALANLRKVRPQIRPNAAFMELLAKWEQSLQDASH
jgi:hypothetical protein